MLSSVRLLSSLKLPILVVLLPARLLLVDIFIEWLCRKCWYLHILFWPFTNPPYLSFLSSEISPSFAMLLLSIYQRMSFFSLIKWSWLMSFRNLSRECHLSFLRVNKPKGHWVLPSFLTTVLCCFLEGEDKIGEVWKCSKRSNEGWLVEKNYLF